MAIRIRRREFIGALGGAAAAWPFVARAQHAPGKVAHVGIIDDSPSWDPFRQRLRELNYVEGQNIAYVYLRTDGSPAQLDAAAAALVQVPVNVIVAFGTPRAQAAQRATKTIPIVAISISDPIAAGLVTSLAHPVGNITGMTTISADVTAKRLQIIRQLLPKLTKIALLIRESSPDTAQYVKESETATRNLGIELQIEIERDPKDLEGVFVAVRGANALVAADDAEFTAHRTQIAELALKNQLPTVFGLREQAEAGGLMAYGPS